MKTFKFLIVFMIVCIIGFSCDSKTYEEISGEVANPTYTNNVKPIIENNCLACHSAVAAELPTMETYAQVRDAAENGNMICRIDDQSCGGVMPQTGRMPQNRINTIKKWVANGYPN